VVWARYLNEYLIAVLRVEPRDAEVENARQLRVKLPVISNS